MDKKAASAFFVLGMIAALGFSVYAGELNKRNPEKVIENFNDGIEAAKEKGEYRCCIEPDCTMCYMGKWKFDKGTCYCDDAIAEGRFDDVCPECRQGEEQGVCTGQNIALNN